MTRPKVAVIAGTIPSPALEARLGVLVAVISTRTGLIAGDPSARTDTEPARETWPLQAVEVTYDPDSIALAQLEEASGGEVADAAGFTVDKASDQKPHLHRAEAFRQHMARVYPDASRRALSTAATRINGYLAGYGTVAGLDAELDSLGLPKPLENALRSRVYPTALPPVDRA